MADPAQLIPGATRRFVETNGIRMSVWEQGHGPAVVLSHGFPELAYSWRHQLPSLAAAGFHAIAPDQRGFGDTDAPADVASYDIHHLAADLVGMLDALGIEKAVFCGHDWGGLVVWMMPLLHPTRVAGVIGVNTAYYPRPPVAPMQIFRTMFGDNYYIVHFQKPGEADAGLARDPRRTFTQLMRGGVAPLEAMARAFRPDGQIKNMVELVWDTEPIGRALLTDEELEVYASTFARTGFTGGINWYRNIDRNWETTAALDAARIEVPSLMITAELDPVLRPEMAEAMKPLVPDLEIQQIEGCGHWTQAERPAELNRILVDWLQRRFA